MKKKWNQSTSVKTTGHHVSDIQQQTRIVTCKEMCSDSHSDGSLSCPYPSSPIPQMPSKTGLFLRVSTSLA